MRRMSWLATIPALALGCATGSSNQKPSSEAVKTQSQAQAALQRAADAQKRALAQGRRPVASETIASMRSRAVSISAWGGPNEKRV